MKKEKMLEIKSWRNDARRGLNREKDLIQERSVEVNAYDQMLDAVDELISENDDLADEVERQQQEIDDLNEQLEQKDAEMANMRLQHQAEIDALQKQLLEAQNNHLESEKQHLESEKQQLVAEVKAKPLEIHNHFGAGSNSQVFNDKVRGRFEKLEKKDKKDKKEKKDKKNKLWNKIVRKML